MPNEPRLPKGTVGFIASGCLGLMGYLLGAPIEALLVLVIVGTTIEMLMSR